MVCVVLYRVQTKLRYKVIFTLFSSRQRQSLRTTCHFELVTSCTSNVCAGMPTHTHTKPTYADLQLSSQEQNPLAFKMIQCSAEHSQCVSCCRQKNSRYAGVCVCSRVCVRALASRIALLRRLETEALT